MESIAQNSVFQRHNRRNNNNQTNTFTIKKSVFSGIAMCANSGQLLINDNISAHTMNVENKICETRTS